MTRGKFSSASARSFERQSPEHIAYLAMVAADHGCECRAYIDWFTYARWSGQGYQVPRDSKARAKTKCFVPVKSKDPKDKGKVIGKRPWVSHLFCRCQVEEVTS